MREDWEEVVRVIGMDRVGRTRIFDKNRRAGKDGRIVRNFVK